MPTILFIAADGTEHRVAAECGASLMEAARNHDVPGIEAECGGCCACATCHVYVRKDWLAITGAAEDVERELLEFADDPREGSRLSCQVSVSEGMDGLVVYLPQSQGFS